MKVLVCGGRDFDNYELLKTVLSALHLTRGITTLMHGDAPGADSLAAIWATRHCVPIDAFPADWRAHGRAAGPRRNQRMLEAKPDMVVAFKGGRGTADMVRRAGEAGLEILNV